MTARIDGIVLAAGRSTRMGQPKPTLKVGDESFLARATRALYAAGCERVLGVLNVEGAHAANGLAVDVVINPDPASEQIDSLRCALAQIDAAVSAVLVLPVDVPRVALETCAAVVSAYRAAPAPVVVPFYRAVAGHPILLARDVFAEIRGGDWPEGVRSVILAHAHDLREVSVNDRGTLIDIDTPDDYRLHIEQT